MTENNYIGTSKNKITAKYITFVFNITYILNRWRNYVADNGSKFQKYQQVSEYVLEQFRISRELLHPVRDVDLVRWGRKAAIECELTSFKGSESWVLNLKKKMELYQEK